jgi:microcystin-dependent protein
MAEPFLGEIRMFGGNFAPTGWALCNGQLLSISQYAALFSLLGTTYGGNGTSTFGLPNLQGQTAIHWGTSRSGTSYVIGEVGGAENVTLLQNQMPQHNHTVSVSNQAGTVTDPTNAIPAQINTGSAKTPATTALGYSNAGPTGAMAANVVSIAGGSVPHSNMQPFQCVTFIIALVGLYPSRN